MVNKKNRIALNLMDSFQTREFIAKITAWNFVFSIHIEIPVDQIHFRERNDP